MWPDRAASFLIGLAGCLALAAGAAPFAYITNSGSADVSVIDVATETVVATIPVGGSPYGVAVSPSGTRVYVTDTGGVSVINATTNGVVDIIRSGAGRGIAVNPAGTRVYVGGILPTLGVAVIDTATNTVITRVATNDSCWGVVVNPAGTRVYATSNFNDNVLVIDAATNTRVTSIGVGRQPQGIAIDRAGNYLYVTNVGDGTMSVIDTRTNAVVRTVPLTNIDAGIALNPAGTRLYVATSPGNVTIFDPLNPGVVVNRAGAPENAISQGVAVAPNGARIYVANFQANTVSVIDAFTEKLVNTINVGFRPVAFGQFIGPLSASYEGLWLKTPFESESGWGINLTHQGDTLFATWFTYDTDGTGMWLVMSNAPRASNGSYTGVLYRTTGPGFNAVPFTSIGPGNYTVVGSLTLSFSDPNTGTMSYTLNGITQTKPIGRYIYVSTPPTCTLGGAPGALWNFQGLWWKSPDNSESGWGVNITHQGDILFATWFTYEPGGTAAAPAKGMWLVMSNGARIQSPSSSDVQYAGDLQRTTGPPFSAVPFNPGQVVRTTVGTANFTFFDRDNGVFMYTLNGITQLKAIKRLVYGDPVTVCR